MFDLTDGIVRIIEHFSQTSGGFVQILGGAVDGRNPAPPGMYKTL